MAVKDGYETCKELKELIKEGVLNEMKIFAHTADITEYNIKKC